MKIVWQALRMLMLLTILTGVIYPLVVTTVVQVIFPFQASGSLLLVDSDIVGSELIGQTNTDARYFWSRPSAVNYMQGSLDGALGFSGATNLSSTSETLAELATARELAFRQANLLSADAPVPAEMVYASGSGLDPHISPEAARLQVDRVAEARRLPPEAVAQLVEQFVEPPQLGIFGQPRVNVLLLNLRLDELAPAS